MTQNPELGTSVLVGTLRTNVHDVGSGAPVLLLHGSGPGVSAWSNWRRTIHGLSPRRRVIAPDIVGFGFTDRPPGFSYTLENWVEFARQLLDAMHLDKVDLVGNSFGGALSLALAIRYPERVRRLVLMGSVGVPFTLTPALDEAWGYTPSLDNMRRLMDLFAFDRSLINDELVRARYAASTRPGVMEAYAAMFPAPRQSSIDSLASRESDIRALPHPALIVHGRDDRIIPMATSLTLAQWIARSQLHVFGQCGHWTQIEHADRFIDLVNGFLDEA